MAGLFVHWLFVTVDEDAADVATMMNAIMSA
jgi:hypothetical protein